MPRVIPLENTAFAFLSRCQLQIASWLGMGLPVHIFLELAFCLVIVCTGGMEILSTKASTYHIFSDAVTFREKGLLGKSQKNQLIIHEIFPFFSESQHV